MNNKQIEILEQCANLLFENHIPRNFLWETIDRSFRVHEWMKPWGLDEKNNYRVNIPVAGMQSEEGMSYSDEMLTFVSEICGCLNDVKPERAKWTVVDKAFIQDKEKNKYKVTRMLKSSPSLVQHLARTKIGEALFEKSGKLDCCIDCSIFRSEEALKRFISSFNIWYGEYIKGDINIILSCNPFDVLTASHDSAFRSCYSIDGIWFNGVLASMISNNALIAFIEEIKNPGRKIGRSWVYVNDSIIVIGRGYGSITDLHHLYIRSFLYPMLGGLWKHKPTLRIGEDTIIMDGPGYLDNNYGSTAVLKKYSQNHSKINKIYIPNAICLWCGKEFHDSGSGGMCKTCHLAKIPEKELFE